MQQLHGAASRVPVDAMAFPHRYHHFNMGFEAGTDDPAQCEKMKEWVRKNFQSVEPFAERAVYVNILRDSGEEGENRVREAYGPNYDRLLALKNKYDPTNFFRPNANIRPTV
jgi:FAD/FMN-containing dehydrogenase